MISPDGNRLHIGIFGSCNAGKSTLINAIANQDVALVSASAGTTTDPVYKAMEIKGIGAVTLIDTAGYDDTTALGALRSSATRAVLAKTDIAILVYHDTLSATDREWLDTFSAQEIPAIVVNNTTSSDIQGSSNGIITLNAEKRLGVDKLVSKIVELSRSIANSDELITNGYVNSGETVVLVMPQDGSAPKGRLILPQVQVIRELLDKRCNAICTTVEGYPRALSELKVPPKLVITDSQAFDSVYALTPSGVDLTSFSILFARQKGDIATFVRGAKVIKTLNSDSRVLIAEACSHAPQSEDIGRVKIPNMLKAKFGVTEVDICAGNDFPSDLSGYDLVIHCGACMFNRRHVLSRVAQANNAKVPITNYGLAIAELKGILDKVLIKD